MTLNKISRLFKKQGNEVVEKTKVTPNDIQPVKIEVSPIKTEAPMEMNVIKLTNKIADLKQSIADNKALISKQDALLAQAKAAKASNGIKADINSQTPNPTLMGGIKSNSKGQIVIKPYEAPTDPTAIVYNMVRLGYRIQYQGSTGLTILLDNIHPIQMILKRTWEGIQPVEKTDFQSIVDNRATLAEINRLYRLVSYTDGVELNRNLRDSVKKMGIYYDQYEKNIF